MIKSAKKLDKFTFITACVFLVSLPFLEFLKTNFSLPELISNNFFILWSLIALLTLLVTAFAVWKVSFNAIRVIVISLCLFWYIQFYFIDLSEALSRTNIYRPYLVAFFVIITATVIFGTIVSLYNVAFRFVFFYALIATVIGIPYVLPYSQQWSVSHFPVSEKKLGGKKHHQNNIFFIVADGLTGIDILNHHFSVNGVTNVRENLISKGFIFPKNAISSYNMTYLTLAAVHNVDYPVYETSKIYEDRSLFYPSILLHKTPLISHLKEANYNYRHYTNLWAPCDRKHVFPCFDANVSSGLPIKFDESIFVFFQKSLITMVFKKFEQKLEFDAISYLFSGDHADAIRLLAADLSDHKTRKNVFDRKNNFVFVHHFIPHDRRTQDCKQPKNIISPKTNKRAYADAATCALSSIEMIVNKILSSYPSSSIFITADHGWSEKYNEFDSFDQTSLQTKKHKTSVFNAIKLGKSCKKINYESLDTVETTRLALTCAGLHIPILGKSRSFWGFYETNDSFGRVFEIQNYNLN